MRFSSLAVNALAFVALSSSWAAGPSWTGIALVSAQEEAAPPQVEEVPPVVEEPPKVEEEAPKVSEPAVPTEEKKEAAGFVPPADAKKYSFEAEVHRMLDIVVNSLYQHNEVFLRELISNAADALDKYRYLSLTEPDKYKTAEDLPLEVKIEYDEEQNTLTIRDTGIGMSRAEMVENLGTVARSGTSKFVQALKASGNPDATISQIGQFGVGFYSSFLVSDRVVVASKNPTDPVQHVWESQNGSADFIVYEDPRGNTLQRGTEITLYLKEDSKEYTNPHRLKTLAKHYSEFVMHPIALREVKTIEVPVDDEDEAEKPKKDDDDLEVVETKSEDEKKTKEVTTHSWEVLNGKQAIWTREKEEIADHEYKDFFKVIVGDEAESTSHWTHFNAEGNINFKSILYLPDDIPSSYKMGNLDAPDGAIRLYVRKVLIGDEFELLPRYLGFIRGVVDSDDLPLNVNRETLQENKILKVIKKKLTRKALDMIRQLAKDSEDAAEKAEAEIDADGNVKEADSKDDKKNQFVEWYKKFSPNIKLGIIEDNANRDRLTKLLRFETSKSNGKLISLDDYVANMKTWQDEIYVLGCATVDECKKSPFLEPFREKDAEVIFMTDAVDEYMMKQVRDYNKKKFMQISSENIKFKDEDEGLIKRREKAYKTKYQPLTKWLRKLYHGTVLRVQVARRSLGSVPAIVTSSDFGNSANMERILKAQAFQHGVDPSSMMAMKIFEINPRHPLVQKLLAGSPPEDAGDDYKVAPDIVDAAWMLHDIAMLNGGFPIADPEAHNKRILAVMQEKFGLESLALEPEINPPVEDDEPPEIKSGAGGMNMDDFDMGGMNMQELDLEELDMDNFDMDD